MVRPSKKEIQQFANETYAEAVEDILSEFAGKRGRVLRDARFSGNSEPNLQALGACEAEKAGKMMLAWAKAYVEAFTTYELPCDRHAEADLRTTALQIAADAVSAVQGEFELAMERTGRHRKFPLEYVNGQIWARTNSSLKKGLLNVKRQRTQFENGSTRLAAEPVRTKAASEVKKPLRQNQRYVAIDTALRAIADSRPLSQIEIFQALEGRGIVIPGAEPFHSARGWMTGFRKNPVAGRAWLSKRWTELGLPTLPRGPKRLKNK